MILFGLAFRAICLANFKRLEKKLSGTEVARRRFDASKRRALLIDAGVMAFGVYILLTH